MTGSSSFEHPLYASVVAKLREWDLPNEFDKLYLFGSLVNNGGDAFIVQGSDVDLLCSFSPALDISAVARAAACRALLDRVPGLELSLLLALKRHNAEAPIVRSTP
jgi:predicted nucleotidyltransferase